MTALTKYQKLESAGLWRSGRTAQLREVVVNLGDTSLVLTDPRTGQALAHWSLPALDRLNANEHPALYSPDPEGAETLELDDVDMVAALEQVHSVLDAARPHPGRLRNRILTGLALGIVLIGGLWLPGALIRHTAAVIPASTRSDIGRVVMADLTRITGQPCTGRRGQQALAKLGPRIFGPGPARRIVVVRRGIETAIHLPGREIVLPESLLAEGDSADIAAGAIVVQGLMADRNDPMIPLLRHAGIAATLRLLTTGALAPGEVAGYAETLVTAPVATVPDAAFLAAFGAAGVPVTPYAEARYPGTPKADALAEGDPFADAAPPPLLADEDWVGLQGICAQ